MSRTSSPCRRHYIAPRFGAEFLSFEIDVLHTAVAFIVAPLAVGEFDTQIREQDVGTVAPKQMLLAVLASASALLAHEADEVARVVFKRQ